jgi:putative phosphoesterase
LVLIRKITASKINIFEITLNLNRRFLKNILLLSDTHGTIDPNILKYAVAADEVWHAGDVGTVAVADALMQNSKLRAVYGNIDGHKLRSQFPEDQIFYCEGLKVFITHIGGYPGRYNARVKKIIETQKPDLYICGHSHILKVIRDKKNQLLHMNPGACGIQGFHQVRTLLRFQIRHKEIENLEVIELGKRDGIIESDR